MTQVCRGFYADLVVQDLTGWLWARPRAELACGSWLRRQWRDADSVGVLGLALAAFDPIGAPVRPDRAAQK